MTMNVLRVEIEHTISLNGRKILQPEEEAGGVHTFEDELK